MLDSSGGQRYELDGELVGTHLGFRDMLPPLQTGRIDLSLQPWHDKLSALLASQNELEPTVRLRVMSWQQQLAQVQVTRFDAELRADQEAQRVCIAETSQARLEVDWQERVSLSILPLWAPSRHPQPLQSYPDHPACWTVPTDLDPGPWWVIGRDGHWARFRPLLWTVHGSAQDPASGDLTLEAAIREPDPETREHWLHGVLAVLGEEADHPDWAGLFELVELTRELPPSILDVLRYLPAHPRTLALALLKADEGAFERVWSLAEGLPFLWYLIPTEDWLAACADHLTTVREALGDADPDGKLVASVFQDFRGRAVARQPFFGPLCDWLQERLLAWQPLGQSPLRVIRGLPSVAAIQIAQAEQDMQSRHLPDDIWPSASEVMDRAESMSFSKFRFAHLAEPFRPVRCAPFVATDGALHASGFDGRLVLDLRLLRAFDPEWFDTVYTIALTLGLAALPPEADL